ncbi:MAG: DUF4040 domain-containing protein [Leptolyngbyaceae cyanobacterium bins.349]|nr:DUF4040 domain-containing protein [Leptolyngbyaceae cyanobacterium bins.349]
MTDSYLYFIVALLPLAAIMVVSQQDPYHALVVRGVLGAIAAMVYAVMGAPDVALTEALVGTMLAITLYAIAVRSSLVMRLGVLEPVDKHPILDPVLEQMRAVLKQYHVRLELSPHANQQSLQRALLDREVHAICLERSRQNEPDSGDTSPYAVLIRVPRLYEILHPELPTAITAVHYVNIAENNHPYLKPFNWVMDDAKPNLEEAHP